jgi:hypothetical protein
MSLSAAETKQAALSSLHPTPSMGIISFTEAILDLMSVLDLQEITLFELCT